MNILQQDLEDLKTEAMLAEEKARKAMMEAAKLAEDLRIEQDNAQRYEAERKMMEAQVKDLQVSLTHFMQCWHCMFLHSDITPTNLLRKGSFG